jgi:hypothetical protein
VWVWRAGVRAGTWSAPAQVALVCLGGAAGLCALVAMVASLPRRGDAPDAAGNAHLGLNAADVRVTLHAMQAAVGSEERWSSSTSSAGAVAQRDAGRGADAASPRPMEPVRYAAPALLPMIPSSLSDAVAGPRHTTAPLHGSASTGDPPVQAPDAAIVCAAVVASVPPWVAATHAIWAALTVAAPLLHAALAVGVVDAVVGSHCTLASPTAGQGGASAGVASSVPGPLALCALALCGVAVVPAVCQVALLASGTGCGRGRGVMGAGALTAVAVALGYPAAGALAIVQSRKRQAGCWERVIIYGRALVALSIAPGLQQQWMDALADQRSSGGASVLVAAWGAWHVARMVVATLLTLWSSSPAATTEAANLQLTVRLPADCTALSLASVRWLILVNLGGALACACAHAAGSCSARAAARVMRHRRATRPLLHMDQLSGPLLAAADRGGSARGSAASSYRLPSSLQHAWRDEDVLRDGVVVRSTVALSSGPGAGRMDSEMTPARTVLSPSPLIGGSYARSNSPRLRGDDNAGEDGDVAVRHVESLYVPGSVPW